MVLGKSIAVADSLISLLSPLISPLLIYQSTLHYRLVPKALMREVWEERHHTSSQCQPVPTKCLMPL